jgi:hypothetical protein
VSAWLAPFRYQIDSRIRGLGLDSRPARWAKTGNNRIQTAGFVNQYSLFTLNPGKMFFAPGLKIFLQQYR